MEKWYKLNIHIGRKQIVNQWLGGTQSCREKYLFHCFEKSRVKNKFYFNFIFIIYNIILEYKINKKKYFSSLLIWLLDSNFVQGKFLHFCLQKNPNV